MTVCPFGCGASQHTPIHFATTCTAAHWTDYQAHLRREVRRVLHRMTVLLTKAHGPTVNSELTAAAESIRAALRTATDADWRTDDYIHVIIRLLNCAPFSSFDVRGGPTAAAQDAAPATVATSRPRRNTAAATLATAAASPPPRRRPHGDPTAMPLSRAVGRMFDSVRAQRSHLRNWANTWTQWSYRNIMQLAGHYNCGRGQHRYNVPCHAHRHDLSLRVAPGRLHDVEHLGDDPAAVDSDPGSNAGSDADSDDGSSGAASSGSER